MTRQRWPQSRRRPGTLVTCLLAGALVASACGAGAGSNAQESGAAADRRGTLKVMTAGLPVSMDPLEGITQGFDYPYLTPVYDRLVEVKPDLSLAPMLARSWQVTDRAVTFKLRSGVKFHDGTPFDADSVVKNVQRIKAAPSSLAAPLIGSVTAVEAIDQQTVRMQVEGGTGWQLVASLASYSELGMASPAAFRTLASKPVGTGLYRVATMGQDRVSYQRVDGYWDAALDKTAPQSLQIIGASEEKARLNALRTGQVDISIFSSVSNQELDALPANYQQKLEDGVHRAIMLLVNANRTSLAKPEVRKALSLAIDRDGVASLYTKGVCQPTIQLSEKGTDGHVAGPKGAYDPTQAKELLANAGVANLKLRLLTPDLPQRRLLATAIQGQLKEIGIDVEIQTVSSSAATSEWESGKFDLGVFGTNGGIDPAGALDQRFTAKGSLDAPDPEIIRMASDAKRLEVESPEREKSYQTLNEYLIENPFHVIVCQESHYVVARPNVLNFDQQMFTKWQAQVDTRYLAVRTGS